MLESGRATHDQGPSWCKKCGGTVGGLHGDCLTLIMFMHVCKQTKPNMSGGKSEIFPDCNFLFETGSFKNQNYG